MSTLKKISSMTPDEQLRALGIASFVGQEEPQTASIRISVGRHPDHFETTGANDKIRM